MPSPPDETAMSVLAVIGIVGPAVGLLAMLALPGELRWARKPPFVTGPPRRVYFAAGFAALLLVGVLGAVAN
jgi:hypothetical protein